MAQDHVVALDCGNALAPAYGSLVVDFEQIMIRYDGERRWRAIVACIGSTTTALLGRGSTPEEAVSSLFDTVRKHGARLHRE